MNLQKIIEKQEELIQHYERKPIYFSPEWNYKYKTLESELASLKAQEESKSDNRYYDAMKYLADWNDITVSDIDCAIINYIQGKYTQSHQVEMTGDVAKTETDTGKLIDMPDITCDVCGRHPAVIVQTQFGRYCMEHAKYV